MSTEQSVEKCACCLDVIDQSWPEYTRMILPACGHAYHTACIAQWLIQAHTCPQCRRQVEAQRREQIAMCGCHSVDMYQALECITSTQGVLNIAYRALLLMTRALAPTLAITLETIVAFNDTMRWLVYLVTEYKLRGDVAHYEAISPVIGRYGTTLRSCALIHLIAVIVTQVATGASQHTEWESAVECAVLIGVCVIELFTQWATHRANEDYCKRVSVDVTYTTIME